LSVKWRKPWTIQSVDTATANCTTLMEEHETRKGLGSGCAVTIEVGVGTEWF
jgi:hypothetical protein